MMAHRLLSSLLLLPCLTVCAFQGHGVAAVSRKRPVSFLQANPLESILTESLSAELESPSSTGSNVVDLPPVLQQIADERREFQLNLGRAMDTLRSDMPDILWTKPGTYHFLIQKGLWKAFLHNTNLECVGMKFSRTSFFLS
jgi:hypothetical protein